jgi:hypothetical protein
MRMVEINNIKGWYTAEYLGGLQNDTWEALGIGLDYQIIDDDYEGVIRVTVRDVPKQGDSYSLTYENKSAFAMDWKKKP